MWHVLDESNKEGSLLIMRFIRSILLSLLEDASLLMEGLGKQMTAPDDHSF